MPDLRRFEVFAKTQAFARHVDTARRILATGLSKGTTVISVSNGKDSTALAHLASLEIGKLDMMHMACAHELPGGDHVFSFMRSLGTLHELPPINDLENSISWLRTVGLPHERTHAAHQQIIQTRKRSRGHDWSLDHGYACTALGMRAEESANRRRLFRARGTTYLRGGTEWVCNPLAWWTANDVWAYLVSRGLPWHRLYDCETLGFTRERLRSGGWLYTDGVHDGWIPWLREHFPDQFRQLVAAFPHMEAF